MFFLPSEVQSLIRWRRKSPTSFLPRDAGESLPRTGSGDEGGGWNDWNQ
jgi:hypothetical protein